MSELTKEYFDEKISGFATKDNLLELATKSDLGTVKGDLTEIKETLGEIKKDINAYSKDIVIKKIYGARY